MGVGRTSVTLVWVLLVAAGLAAWGAQTESPLLQVAATTSIVGDVVRVVGGDRILLSVLFPPGVDPHTFEPTPREMASLSDARTVFINGGGLEILIDSFLKSSDIPIVSVSDGIAFRTLAPGGAEEGVDPHVWFDPTNVVIWAGNIARTLAALDPQGADGYASRALVYEQALLELDSWIAARVATLRPNERSLVTDHDDFAYLARRYGFDEAGTVIPSLSTLAEPSAQGFAALEATVRERGVRAVFVGTTVDPTLAQELARDTGIRVEFLYTEALSAPGGTASTYLDLMRYDVDTIVRALRGEP